MLPRIVKNMRIPLSYRRIIPRSARSFKKKQPPRRRDCARRSGEPESHPDEAEIAASEGRGGGDAVAWTLGRAMGRGRARPRLVGGKHRISPPCLYRRTYLYLPAHFSDFSNSFKFFDSFEFSNSFKFSDSIEFSDSFEFSDSYEFSDSIEFSDSFELSDPFEFSNSFEFSKSSSCFSSNSSIAGYIHFSGMIACPIRKRSFSKPGRSNPVGRPNPIISEK